MRKKSLLEKFPASTFQCALSIARDLNMRLHTPILTIARLSDNATLDIYAMSSGLLDIFAAIMFTGTSSAVITKVWDKSGNGYHLTQSNLAKAPYLIISGVLQQVHGLALSNFNGTGNLNCTIPRAANYMMFHVTTISAVSAYLMGTDNTGSGGAILSYTDSTNGNFKWFNGGSEIFRIIPTYTNPIAVLTVYKQTSGGTLLDIEVNGVNSLHQTSNLTSEATKNLKYIGGSTSTDYSQSKFAEYIQINANNKGYSDYIRNDLINFYRSIM